MPSKSCESINITVVMRLLSGGEKVELLSKFEPRWRSDYNDFQYDVLHTDFVQYLMLFCKFLHRSVSFSTSFKTLPSTPPSRSPLRPYFRRKPHLQRLFFRSAGRKVVDVCLFLTFDASVERNKHHQSKSDQTKSSKSSFKGHIYSYFLRSTIQMNDVYFLGHNRV